MTMERQQYERGWCHCEDCSGRRPRDQVRVSYVLVGRELRTVKRCTDAAMCAALKAAVSTAGRKVSP